MSFIQADDEDVDFLAVGTGNSKLVNIFTEPHHDATSDSLKFIAPKQPRKVDTQTSAGISMSALFTAVVHGYKFDGNKYTLQGKLGAAILGNHSIRSYKLLLYKGKQQPVAIATINSKFVFTVQNNRYASFTDDQQGNWSVMFDSDSILEEFAKQIALAKANSMGSGESVVISQPLTVGEGSGLEVGDTAQILYTGYLLTNFCFGPAFETNQGAGKPFKIKLGKGKYIKGLEEGLVGAKRNSKILLVIPPSLGFGSQGLPAKVPPESTLLYEVEIIRVKGEKELRSSTPTPTKHLEQPQPTSSSAAEKKTAVGHTSGDDVRLRSTSSPEQPHKSDKAQIISRMAKMGMSMLPGMTPSSMYGSTAEEVNVVADASENEEEVNISPAPPQVYAKSRAKSLSGHTENASPPVESAHKNLAISSTIPIAYTYDPRAYGFSSTTGYMGAAANSGSGYGPALPFPPPTIMDPHLPLLITETRTQNTEIRLMLNKLGDKLDSLVSKVDSGGQQRRRGEDVVTFRDIERLIEDNSKLKLENSEKALRITNLSEKMSDLTHKPSKLSVEEIPAEPHAAEIRQLQEDKTDLENQLTELQRQFEDATAQLKLTTAQMAKLKEEKSGIHSEHGKEVSLLQKQLKDSQHLQQELQKQVDLLQASLNESAKSREKLEASFKEKKKVLLEEKDRIKKEMEEVMGEYKRELEEMHVKIEKMEKESVLNNSKIASEAYVEQVTKDVENQWKVKYDLLQAENDLFKMESQGLIERLKNQMSTIQDEAAYNANLNIELKRLVNAVYRSLQNDIEPNGSYLGVDILQLVLETFRTITLQLLDSYQKNDKSSSGPVTPTSETTSKDSPGATPAITNPQPSPQLTEDQLEQEILSPEIVSHTSSQIMPPQEADGGEASPSKRYMFYDTKEKQWKPQPPPPPLFEEEDDMEEDEEEWLK